ncbi:hypothetical protein AN964_16405 [Heyndrickxia shackletonii]|uniref:Uncharacterized protein n=1 Tax=Heyndrickxia shackletonii TaxID=157838 RepID=A0A0Q3TLR9_9BACI|nr:hypothetical protein AN964_16405 [Heyndrickxia shackletonii]
MEKEHFYFPFTFRNNIFSLKYFYEYKLSIFYYFLLVIIAFLKRTISEEHHNFKKVSLLDKGLMNGKYKLMKRV